MTRREGRDSDSRRHRSRFDREPSPKRSRRDGKPATERVPSSNNLDVGDHVNQDKTHRHQLQDALPLETPSAPDSKIETRSGTEDLDKNSNGFHEKKKHSSGPTDVPRSRNYFQHDERGNAGQVGRSFVHRAAAECDWRGDSRNRKNERTADRKETYTRQRDEKSQAKGVDSSVWQHDEFFNLEADPPPAAAARKKRAFREEKIPLESENVDKPAAESVKVSHLDRPALGNEIREERSCNPRYSDRSEKPGDRLLNRGEAQRGGYPSRQRYGSGGGHSDYRGRDSDYRGGDRYDRRQGFRSNSTRGEKWKHDLFQDANRSPTPKDEEDQVAKVEALLAS